MKRSRRRLPWWTLRRAVASRWPELFVGLLVFFMVAVEIVRWVRIDLLLDTEPAWQLARLLLALVILVIATSAGALAAALCSTIARTDWTSRGPIDLPFGRGTLIVICAVAIATGTCLRIAALDWVPDSVWIDDASEIAPALALRGSVSDVPPWAYNVPSAPWNGPGSVGTLYLEFLRASLKLFGITMWGLRAPAALASIASLVTAALLGRAMLPRGGAALTALVLAGLRWHLIMSRWGWTAVVLIPFVDLAALAMFGARRRSSVALAALSGVFVGLGAHIHLSGWIAAAGLVLWSLWPSEQPRQRSLVLAAVFVAAFACVTAPLWLGASHSVYFSRVGWTPFRGIEHVTGLWRVLDTAEAAMSGPWWTPDPLSRHDLPGRPRLDFVIGIAVAMAFLRSFLKSRNDLSGWLLSNCVAALAATLWWGRQGTPNSFRSVYLTTPTAVAAAAGLLWLLAAIPVDKRRAAALAMVGVVSVSGVLGARDALLKWPVNPATIAGFNSEETLIGRAAARWDAYGPLELDRRLDQARPLISTIRRYRLDPALAHNPIRLPRSAARFFRVSGPLTKPAAGERLVEQIRDSRGRELAVVFGRQRG